ncbi:MAG: hypothetical protein UFG06_13850 [Lachnospiraceae bacterium]|nr:hypothetical protein [Lachnospiraceae bacterium]
MEYKDLAQVNAEISFLDIKGKKYADVANRIKAFRKLFPDGVIRTRILSNENGVCVMIAECIDGKGNLLATGHAYEKEDSSFINKTSYIENCETSAVGRALGFIGIGVDNDIASANEVLNAEQQQADEKLITKVMVKALDEKCKNDGVDAGIILDLCHVEKFEDIKCKVYYDLVNNWDKVLKKNERAD